MSGFVRLTMPRNGPVFIRKDMVAAFGRFRDETHVVLVNEDVDYTVKEHPDEIVRMLEDNCDHKMPNESLTNQHPYGIIGRGRRSRHGVETRGESAKMAAERGGQVPATV